MVQGTYRLTPQYRVPPVFSGVSIPRAAKWAPSLTLWGGSALVAVLFFADSIPLYRTEVLKKLPGIGWYYNDEIHPEDNPF